jgi:hypothetical protein
MYYVLYLITKIDATATCYTATVQNLVCDVARTRVVLVLEQLDMGREEKWRNAASRIFSCSAGVRLSKLIN